MISPPIELIDASIDEILADADEGATAPTTTAKMIA
jgi:hypothetical protein